jgi:hypothetical protein
MPAKRGQCCEGAPQTDASLTALAPFTALQPIGDRNLVTERWQIHHDLHQRDDVTMRPWRLPLLGQKHRSFGETERILH